MEPSKDEVIDQRKTLCHDPVFYLSKLAWEIHEIRNRLNVHPAERIFMSINAAMTGWHIHEWLWKTTTDAGRASLTKATHAKGSDFAAFVRAVQKSCEAIGVCRQFATAQKHYGVRFDRQDVYYEVLGRTDGQEDDSTRVIIYTGGRAFEDVDVYTTALIAWSRLYAHVGYPSTEEVTSLLPLELRPAKALN